MGKKKTKHRKTDLFPRGKLNSIEKLISKALIDSDISREKFTLVINEKQNCLQLKKSIRTKDNQLDDIERDRMIEHGKRIKLKEIPMYNEKQSLKPKTEI